MLRKNSFQSSSMTSHDESQQTEDNPDFVVGLSTFLFDFLTFLIHGELTLTSGMFQSLPQSSGSGAISS